MKKTTLVIMAAGIGSRFGGGIKQLEPVGPNGEIIMDYSIHDALEAGFNKVVFIIRHDLEKDFKEIIGNRIEKICKVEYAFQEINNLPEGFSVPEGRRKPWGTAHAILCCLGVVDAPFAVINADDYYGANAFVKIYDFLKNAEDDSKYHYAMVGYRIKNTVTEKGTVSRGICQSDENSMLTEIVERTKIGINDKGIYYTEDGVDYDLDPDALVSMNLWGFTPSYISECAKRFPAFLAENLQKNPEKCEFFLPGVVSDLISEGKADVKVLDNTDKWYGVTYKEDKEDVVEAFRRLKEEGVYPVGF